MSGRRRPSSLATVCCVVKSQYSTMPASSTTARSCCSPQLPRISGRRSAVFSCSVSRRSREPTSPICRTCSVSVANACARRCSLSSIWPATRCRWSSMGLTMLATAWRRCSSSAAAALSVTRWRSSVSSSSRLLVRSSASCESSRNCSASSSWVRRRSPSRCSASTWDRSRAVATLATSSSACLVSAAWAARSARSRSDSARRPSRSAAVRARSVALTRPPEAEPVARQPRAQPGAHDHADDQADEEQQERGGGHGAECAWGGRQKPGRHAGAA